MKKLVMLMMFVIVLVGCTIDQGIDMANEVSRETLTGKNAIQNYEWFKTQVKRIKSQYNKEDIAKQSVASYISMMPEDRTTWDKSDKFELSRLNMIYDGLKYQTSDMIAEYEARCSMTNRALFKDNLPTNIFRGIGGAVEFKYGSGIVGGAN